MACHEMAGWTDPENIMRRTEICYGEHHEGEMIPVKKVYLTWENTSEDQKINREQKKKNKELTEIHKLRKHNIANTI